ncbi:helix-turn-helix domain-containing protein [Rhizobium sp. P32RR-XVIII]|uniref:transcriptional regulator n=1 Tax=Rhizobium sp. P32RR-XVIII TaxID=2726738 RepID=UPI0014572AE0|nr:YdaS family helix-turn-helix protein [Rhizobium sp. P32RR-XVIII]NLS02299.1 helix-turn-helix domain-containing protein [Rhizobium sp. P32RR-XVIII]
MEKEQACLDALIEARLAAGGSSAIARSLGHLTPQAVLQWRAVPADRVLDVEKISGISRYRLRPDVFGLAPRSEEAA